jgi:capsular polysaccharide biosynthesis protein
MAVQVESQGQVQEFVDVLGRRRWQVILPALFVLALGCVAAVIVPKKYRVQTRIELREARVQEDPQRKNPEEAPTAREIYNAEHHIIHRNRVQKLIRDELKWDDYARLSEADRELYIDRVLKNIEVAVLQKARNEGSTFVDIYYADVDPQRAVTFLNRLARLWVTEVIDRDRNVLRKELDLAQDRLAEAQKYATLAGKQLADLLQQNDLDLVEPTAYGQVNRDKVDVRIGAAELERDGLVASIAGLQAQIEALEQQWANTEPTIPVVDTQEGTSNVAEVAALESAIKDLQAKQRAFKPAHTSWQLLDEEIKSIEKKLTALQQTATEAQVYTRFEPNPLRPQLRQQIDQLAAQAGGQKARLLVVEEQLAQARRERSERVEVLRRRDELKREKEVRDEEYALQQREYTRKKAALEAATEAYGNPFEFTSEAQAPRRPNYPNPWVIVGFAAIAGIAFGLASALLTEYSRNCYRGVGDVARVLSVPVLGVVSTIVTRAELRRRRMRRLTTAFSTVAILGGLAWFTWAWVYQREVLPTGLVQAIADLQLALK